MLAECADQLDEPFRRSEIVEWFRRHHPEVRESTLGAHIQAATGNAANRARNHPGLARRAPLLQRIDHGLYVRADRSRLVPEVQKQAARSKYDALREHLAGQAGNEVAMTFAEIENLVGQLPASARIHRAWWANGANPEAQAWRAAGWRVQSVNQSSEEVIFARTASGQTPPRQQIAPDRPPAYIDAQVIAGISARADMPQLDCTKLLKLISELNENYSHGNGYTAHAMLRAILDHIPPMLGHKNFTAVVNNYPWSQTDKAYMRKLLDFRTQADDVLHRQISHKRDLLGIDDMPPRAGVNRLLQESADQALQIGQGGAIDSETGALVSRPTGQTSRAQAADGRPTGRRPVEQAERPAESPTDLMALTASARESDQAGEAGEPARARDELAALLLKAQQVLGPEHPETLTIQNRLARWTGLAGDAVTARDQAAALLPVVERVLGLSHPDTLGVRANTAGMTRAAKDPASAGDQYAALLPLVERILGPEHPDTLAVRAGLAWSTGETGDAAGARDQFAALIPVFERVRDPEHPDTLNGRAGLARWTGGVKDAAGARDQFAVLLPVFERVRGPEHPDTLYIRHSLARWTGQAGNPAGARAQFAALLPMRERILGPEHPDTAASRSNLAHWTRKAEGSLGPGLK